jgi:predicted phosphodiesterase
LKALAIAFGVGAVAGFLALGLVPAAQSEVGPSTLSLRAFPGSGDTIVHVPPLGTVSASTQMSPISLDLSLREVDIEALAPLATSEAGRDQLRSDVEEDMDGLVLRGVLQIALGMIIASAIVVAVVFRREPKKVAAGAVGGLVVATGLVVSTGLTYDVDAFREPRFTGALTRAQVVIDALQENAGLLDEARSRYEVATQRASDLLLLIAESPTDPRTDTTALLHVSDIHGNPIGLEITHELAREFGVDAVVDTGDLASSTIDTGELRELAEPLERSMLERIQRLPAPYIFVAGNHDSFELRRELAGTDNVIYLDRETTTVGAIEILGVADPTYSTQPVEIEEKNQTRLDEAPETDALVADETPDVLLVHDERLAAESFGDVPVIMAGHEHERALREEEGTLILTVGSTGATGLKAFTIEADRPYEAEIIYFDDTTPVAVDYITLTGLGSDFIVERDVFGL